MGVLGGAGGDHYKIANNKDKERDERCADQEWRYDQQNNIEDPATDVAGIKEVQSDQAAEKAEQERDGAAVGGDLRRLFAFGRAARKRLLHVGLTIYFIADGSDAVRAKPIAANAALRSGRGVWVIFTGVLILIHDKVSLQ